jgi:hypothetical protein
MKKPISIGLLALNFFFSTQVSTAQSKVPNNSTVNAAGAVVATGIVAGVAGLITAGIAYDRWIESLELDATELYLRSGQAAKAFELQLMPNQLSSFKDLSNTTVLAFAITESNIHPTMGTLERERNKVLLMYVHDGWVTEYGVNFAFVDSEILTDDKWSKLYLAYLNLILTKPIQDPNSIPLYQQVKLKEYTDFEGDKVVLYDGTYSTYYIKFNGTIDLRGPFQHTDKALMKPIGTYEEEWLLVSPKVKLSNDEYITADYDDEQMLIYNEGKLGIYYKKFNRLVQMSTNSIEDIHNFLKPRN